MAVSAFFKSGGIAALALAIALPATAFAQERGRWGGRGGDSQQAQQQQSQGGGQQGGGRWQGRGDGGGNRGGGELRVRPQPQVQAQPPVQIRPQVQAQSRWQGSGDANRTRAWRQGNVQTDSQQTTQRQSWGGRSRSDDRRSWTDTNRTQLQRGDNRWSGDGARRWDNDRNRVDGNRRWSGNDGRRWNNNWRRDNRYNWYSYRNSNRDIFRMGRYYSPYRSWSYRRLNIGFMLQPLFYSSNYWINDPSYYRLPEAYGPYRWVRYYDDALLVDIYSGEVVDVITDFFW